MKQYEQYEFILVWA